MKTNERSIARLTSGAPQTFRVTHPFHPLCGPIFQLIECRQTWDLVPGHQRRIRDRNASLHVSTTTRLRGRLARYRGSAAVRHRRSSTICPSLPRTQIRDSFRRDRSHNAPWLAPSFMPRARNSLSDGNPSARRDRGQPLHLICFAFDSLGGPRRRTAMPAACR
jgi:hypothetical protein